MITNAGKDVEYTETFKGNQVKILGRILYQIGTRVCIYPVYVPEYKEITRDNVFKNISDITILDKN